MIKKIIIFFLFLTLACDKEKLDPNDPLTQIRVSVFLFENCPVAQYMTLPMNDIYTEFSDENISFTGYFPNILSSTGSIASFQDEYSILYNCIDDQDGHYVESLGANVYAEVFVEQDDVILYNGMVNNSYSALGQWSPADKHYLYDVLSAIINGDDVPWESNDAIGCLI
jgi:hypothetical protein